MNYFFPDWKKNSIYLERDAMMNIVKLFEENEEDFTVVIINHIPFLRYQLHEFGINIEQIISLFDKMQNIRVKDGFPLDIDDLFIPPQIEKVYTPFGISLVEDGRSRGNVTFNRYGFIEEITLIEEMQKKRFILDDRGFISAKLFFNERNELDKKLYLNELGEITAIEYMIKNPRIEIINYKKRGFQKNVYQNMNEILTELIENFKQTTTKQDHIISIADSRNLEIIKENNSKNKIIRVVTDFKHVDKHNDKLIQSILSGNSIVVTDDTKKTKKILKLMGDIESLDVDKIKKIPFYATNLQLGMSNSIAQLVMYWYVGQLDNENKKIHEHLLEKIISNFKYDLIIEVSSFEDEKLLREIQKETIDDYFAIDSESEDFQKVWDYFEAKKEKKLFKQDEEAVEELRKSKNWRQLVDAIEAYSRIKFRVAPTISKIKNDFQNTRLYLDLTLETDTQKQALAVSAGIPQIVRTKTDYIKDTINGKIIKSIDELDETISFYLDNLSSWNQSLVDNIEFIEKFSVENVIEEWRNILYGS